MTQKYRLIFVSSLLAALAGFSPSSFSFPVHVATAPENTLGLTLATIQSARQSILLNVYELASPEIVQALIEQINRGVHVEILQEGAPVGGIAAAARGLQSQIVSAMADHPGNRYVEMNKPQNGTRRFHYDHAKYIVIDNQTLLVGSENYATGGQPQPGTKGNRGWEVLVEDPQPAQWFAQTFASDSDASQADIQNLLGQRGLFMAVSSEELRTSSSAPTRGNPRPVKHPLPPAPPVYSGIPTGNPTYDAQAGQVIVSPNNSLQGLVALIQSAKSSLDIEQMSFNFNWRISNAEQVSPLVQAILDAARRGVQVRILLNDEMAFAGGAHGATQDPGTDPLPLFDVEMFDDEMFIPGTASTPKTTANRKTVAQFLDIARTQELKIQARIANLKAMGVSYIHNKGMIVDGNQTLISSINWTQNAVQNNREAALALTGSQIAAYYENAFLQDWQHSASGVAETLSALESVQTTALEPELGPTANQVPSICPERLKVSAQIGDIQLDDDADASYRALSHTSITELFTRDTRLKRCILTGSKNRVVEVVKNSADSTVVSLEGYTLTNKPFTIRGELPSGYDLTPALPIVKVTAQVMEGNAHGGGKKDIIGKAAMDLEVQ